MTNINKNAEINGKEVFWMWDWLKRIVGGYREIQKLEERRNTKIKIRSGLEVSKWEVSVIVNELLALQSEHYTRYSELVSMIRRRDKLESLDDQCHFLSILMGIRIKEGDRIFALVPIEITYQVMRVSIDNKGVIVSPVEGMALDDLLAP